MVVEIATFRPAVDEEAFLAADRQAQTDYFYGRPGLIRRTTAKGHDGDWTVVTLWASEEDATAAMAGAASDPAARAFLAALDPASVRVERYQTLD